MNFGSTTGRGFESAATPYIWGTLAVVALLLWLWFHVKLNRSNRDDD